MTRHVIYREPGDMVQIVAQDKQGYKYGHKRCSLLGRDWPPGTRVSIILAVPFWEGMQQGKGRWSWGLTGRDIHKLAREIVVKHEIIVVEGAVHGY